MKKGIVVFLLLVWLPATTYAGYLLAEESFGWIDKPYFGLTPPKPGGAASILDLKAIQDKLPKTPQEASQILKSLTAKQIDCLKGAVSPENYTAALNGQYEKLPPDQIFKALACLK